MKFIVLILLLFGFKPIVRAFFNMFKSKSRLREEAIETCDKVLDEHGEDTYVVLVGVTLVYFLLLHLLPLILIKNIVFAIVTLILLAYRIKGCGNMLRYIKEGEEVIGTPSKMNALISILQYLYIAFYIITTW